MKWWLSRQSVYVHTHMPFIELDSLYHLRQWEFRLSLTQIYINESCNTYNNVTIAHSDVRVCTFEGLLNINTCIYFVIIIIITFLYISESINVLIYLVTYRSIGPGAFCVFVYVIVYNYVNVCTSHNNKPFTYLLNIIWSWNFRITNIRVKTQ